MPSRVTVDGTTYEWDTNRLLNTEAIALQKVTGMSTREWFAALEDNDPYALTGLVWLLRRRAGDEVPFDQVEFDLVGLAFESDEPKKDDEPDPTPAAGEGGENPT